jgi:hypothetical protein
MKQLLVFRSDLWNKAVVDGYEKNVVHLSASDGTYPEHLQFFLTRSNT